MHNLKIYGAAEAQLHSFLTSALDRGEWLQTSHKQINNQHVYYKRDINQFTIAEFQLKLNYETWDLTFM
jgi:hypothetical protein